MFSGKVLTVLFLMLTFQKAQSQSYSGFLEDNYNGVHGILSNPANIADSRLKLDVNLAGVSTFFGNDYLGANLGDLFRDFENTFDEASKSPKNNNFLAGNLDILGPSAMLSMSQKHSIAVYTRGRILLNIDDVNGNTIDKEGGFNENEDFFVNEGDISGQLNLMTEIGATYARVLADKKNHFLKGGLTLKYLSGVRHDYINGSGITVDYDNALRLVTTTGQLTQGRDFSEGSDVLDDLLSFGSSSGFGADLGLVYEWRPDHAKYTLMDANGNPKPNRGVNKYKLKLGLSITDIGRINNENGEEETYNLNTTQDVDNFDGLDLDEALQENFTTIGTTRLSAPSALPTALHATADWNIGSKFYLNLNTDISLRERNRINTAHVINQVGLTPRLETAWLSIYSPISLMQGIGLRWGAGLRIGPFYLGSGSVLTSFLGQTRTIDAFAGVKVPIYQAKLRDRDNDGIFNQEDACPDVPGPVENQGCPWPDTDKDGVLDKDDSCIDQPGPAENDGCPWKDTDEDGILDKDDSCPNEAGPVENQGCPWKDTDNDGVLDHNDNCPEAHGLAEFDGCPDTDGDGIMDKEDRCPNEAGSLENKGCPDTDGDTLVDLDDECPNVAGPVSNNGCPEVTQEVQKQLNDYARTILFDTGKATIKTESVSVMVDIIQILNEYPNAKFTVEGHTDSVGSSESNQKLSEARANAVLNLLINEGISSTRLTAIGFGEDKPIATNDTANGRKQNRRVEINLVK